MKTRIELIKIINQAIIETRLGKWECSVCGMDEWCGTDGCPMDPQ